MAHRRPAAEPGEQPPRRPAAPGTAAAAVAAAVDGVIDAATATGDGPSPADPVEHRIGDAARAAHRAGVPF
jgi:hypothetical protein